MINRRTFLAALPAGAAAFGSPAKKVNVLRVPDGGVQPQLAMDAAGNLHMVYLHGDNAANDVFYAMRPAGAKEFGKPTKVNSQPGSAIATGTVRGAHIAAGRNGQIHLLWNGSQQATPKAPSGGTPLLYTSGSGAKFAPERSLMHSSGGLDGGGALAATADGAVLAFWHGKGKIAGEEHRRVYLAASIDDGRNFSDERPINQEAAGVCGCCGMSALASSGNRVYALYRSATQSIQRDMRLLSTADAGKNFKDEPIQGWEINACPMSTASFTDAPNSPVFAWETAKQIYFSPKPSTVLPASGTGPNRKHPSIARQSDGTLLLAWTEGTAWKKGGSLVWQVLDPSGAPLAPPEKREDLPVWGLPATSAERDRSFTIIY